jgi:integrase
MERTLSNRRRYLTANELEKLIKAGRKGRYGRRDATLMLLMVRHGLRVTEAIDLRWDQIDFSKGHLHVRRLKGGIHSVHPVQGDELRALRELRREQGVMSAFDPKRTSVLLRAVTSCVADIAAHPPQRQRDQNADRHVIEKGHTYCPATHVYID